VHIVELSTAVVKVYIKIINAIYINSKSIFTMCNAAPRHVEIQRLCDATELNNDGMIRLGDVHYQTEPNLSIFPKEI